MSPTVQALSAVRPPHHVITHPLRRLAYRADASFYRLTPGAVVAVESQAQVPAVLQAARTPGRALTCHAPGTRPCGHVVTDSVALLRLRRRPRLRRPRTRRPRAGPAARVWTNRTCASGLSAETGRPCRSIAGLLVDCSRPEPHESC